MGTLYLVRHAQASFGAADYDQLSELGHRQSVRLGEYFRDKGVVFDAVVIGGLKRHAQTLAGIAEGMQWKPDALVWPGLNEYDSEAVVTAIHPLPLAKPDTPEMVRHHFRLLRDGLTQWMSGTVSPRGMPDYSDWRAGIVAALDHVRQNCSGNVLMVSSGGPIATAVGHVLGTSAETTIELNLRIRNTAVTSFDFNPKRMVLLTFNTLTHLEHHAEHAAWITHA